MSNTRRSWHGRTPSLAVEEVPFGPEHPADRRDLPGEHAPVELSLGVLAEQVDSVLFLNSAGGRLCCRPDLRRIALGALVTNRSLRAPVPEPIEQLVFDRHDFGDTTQRRRLNLMPER